MQNTQITLFDFYQYTSIIELALFDVTPKAQLGTVRIDQALIEGIPWDINLLIWVDYVFLGWIITHVNNANLPITSFVSWIYQFFIGGKEYFPFALADLQFYANPSFYIDPFLSQDISILPDWIFYHLVPAWGENLFPSMTGQVVLVNQWILDVMTDTTLTPPLPSPCFSSAC